MKRFWAVFIIILSSLIFLVLERQNIEYYRVLEVIEGDKFYIDLNKNGIKDKDEIFHVKNVNAFPSKYNSKVEEYAERYDITVCEALSLGEAAKNFAKEKLEGKEISFKNPPVPYNPRYYYRFAEILTEDNKDFGIILLEEGLGFAYESKSGSKKFNPYKVFENLKKLKKNAAFYSKTCLKNEKQDFKKDKQNQGFQRDVNLKTPIYTESPVRKFGDVTVFLINPNTLNKPSNTCKTAACRAILTNIGNAQKSIDFALYGFEGQNEILKALIEAKNRGVKIRGVVDSKADNSFVYRDTTKLISNFQAISDFKAPFMHNKFFIFDEKSVITGTMNISASGCGGYNANTVVLIENSSAAAVFTREFENMYGGNFGTAKENNSKQVILNDGTSLDIYFSPMGNPLYEGILPLIKRAKQEIFISIFYLTNKEIIEALIEAKNRGVDVKIIYDAVGANAMKERVKRLRASGVFLKVENWGGKEKKKNMVIDGKIFITGSANFSNSGMKKNDENVLIFKNPEIAGFYREYFLKLYHSVDNKYLKFIPRAESFESGNSCYDGIDNNFDGKTDFEDAGCKR